jgi:phage shock protein A
LFWFDNYHYQNKFTFASLEDVESALEAVEEEYAKIIATFRGSEGEKYNNNVEAVESYLASAARLAATSSGDQTVADEIVELAPMYAAGIIGADNSINDAYEEMMNGIHSSEIDTLAEFLVAFQAALEAAPGD